MNWWLLKRKIHSSWLIAICSAGIFIGIFSSQYINNPFFSSIICLIMPIFLTALVLWRKYVYLIPFILLAGIIFGLWRGSIAQNKLDEYQSSYGKTVVVEGSIKDDPDIDFSGQVEVRLDNVIINNKPMLGIIWVSTSNIEVKRGDKIEISGQLRQGFGNFAGVIYQAVVKKVIHPQPGDIARVVRDWFAVGVKTAIPEPESSLGLGFLLGQRKALPADLIIALQAAGLTHIVVASGYNLTILVRLARRLFNKVSKYLSALSAILMIVSFVAITGVSPSMSRAGLVSILSLAAWYYGRKFHPIILLLLAIAVTVTINPSYAWGDLGWQLSFMAFAGVMIVAPLVQRYLFGDKKPGTISQILGETISAQLVTAPIIIVAFGQLSNVAIISNLFILPFVPLAMLLTFIAGIGGLAVPSLAGIIAIPAMWLLKYMVNVTEYLASLPWAVAKIDLKWWAVGLYYVILCSLCFYMWRKTKFNLRETNLVE